MAILIALVISPLLFAAPAEIRAQPSPLYDAAYTPLPPPCEPPVVRKPAGKPPLPAPCPPPR